MAATGYNVQTTADTISFRDQTTGVASIAYDHSTETLTISHDGTGAISFGDSSSDVFIGDGVNSVDLIFEVDGAVKGDTDVALTLGSTDSDILIASPVATITGSQIASQDWVGRQGFLTTDANTFREIRVDGTAIGSSETVDFLGGTNITLSSVLNGGVRAITISTTDYTAGNGLDLSGGEFKIDDPVNLSQLTESTDATSDKILLWDESASLWKYMTMDDLQDSIDTNTNTFRTVTAGGNTLGASETLAFTAGSNISISESAGAVTINSSHPTISAASSSNNSGRTYIQDITLDGNGHVTGITTATETVTDTNTTYSAGNGISLSGTTFSVAAGGGLTQDASGLSHTDTSSQASVNNSNGTVIQDITLDTYGHVSGIGSANLDNRYARRYEGSVSNISNSGYTTIATVSGSQLMSAIRMTVSGTANNVVVANVLDIIVNHHQDIQVEALSSNYTRLFVKLISNNDDSYAIQVKTNSSTAATLYFNILALHEESVAFTSSHSYTGATLEVDCESGKVIKGTGGDDGDIKSHGVFRGNGSGLTNVNASSVDANVVGASQLNVSGNGTTAQFLRSDGDGTFTWATPTDTNTTYSAGTHLSLSGTTFNVDFATANKVVNIGHNSTNNEGEIILDTSAGGSPQISFTDHGDASWAIGVDDQDNSFKIHGSATSTIPTINNLATPLFEITTGGLGYLGTNRLFADNYHPNADKLTTARNIALTGAVTGNGNFDGSGNLSISTTATSDPTLTLSGDASGSATFTNLGNATLTVTVADDSHNHVISNVDGLQSALDLKAPLASPTLTGTPTAPTAATSTNTTQIATTAYVKAQGYVTTDTNTTYSAGNGLSLSGTTFKIDDPVNLSQLTESTDATSDKILLWDESASLWKYMTMDDLQDSIDTNTTYSLPLAASGTRGGVKIGYSENGKNYPVELDSSEKMFVNVPWTDTNTTYSAGSGLTLDGTSFSVTEASSSTRGAIKLFSNTDQSVAANAVSTTAGRTYGVQLNSSGQAVVNVPWVDTNTDTNTTYSAGNGISLSGTTFSVAAGGGLTQTSTGLSHTDTSSQSSVNNSNGTVIQDITLDGYGHITAIGSANLDSRYYTESEVTNQFKTLTFQGNYMNTYDWSTDSSGSTGAGWDALGTVPYFPNAGFSNNGTTAENTRSIGELPNGAYGVVWRTPLSDTANNDDGGWNCTINGVQDSKLYRSVVYFRRTADVDAGTFYHGCNGSHTANISDATNNTNPYFSQVSIDDKFVVDRWYVSVGYIQPYQSGGGTNSTRSGVYDCVTGKKIYNGTDFMMKSGSTSQQHRTYIYYTTNTATEGEWWGPRFEEVNGNEPSIRELIAKGADGELGMTIHSKFDPATLEQLTEASDAADDKFLLWDQSNGNWKYMRMDDLQDSIDTNTTYTLGSFGVTATAAEINKLDGVTATTAELNYVDGVTSNIQTQLNAKQASGTYNTIIGTDSDINTSGSTIIDNIYVTDGVITSMGTRTLTLADLGYTGATNANNYSLPEATATSRGGIELFSNTDQSVAANAVSSTAGRTYGIQLNSAGQAVVNVPWVDTNTDTNTFRTVTAGGNTLGASETLAFTAGSNVTITESSGEVTIAATDTDTVYTHPSHTARTVDVNANSGATILSTLDISVNTLGHVTAASATTRTLTLANLGYTGATDANNYSLPLAASGTRGGVKIGYTENGKNYPVEIDSSEQMFVNVPWTDTNTTYNLGSFGITATSAEINKLDGVTATTAELNYTDGVTSNIQTQLNAKAPKASPSFTGNVGIGATTPLGKLHVYQSDNTKDAIVLRGGGQSGSVQGKCSISMSNFTSETNPAVRITVQEQDASDYRSNLLFLTRSSNSDVAPTERMRIRYDGNVGIGTTSTLQRATISGPNTSPSLNSTTASSATLHLANSDTGYGTYFASLSSGVGVIQQRRQTSNVQYSLALNPYGGNVGIGKTNPSTALDVSGSATVSSVVTAAAFRTNSASTSYSLITRNTAASNYVMYVQATQSGTTQKIATFGYGSGTAGQATEVFRIARGNINAYSSNLTVGGSITGNSKNFSIPHPTKEGKRLVHSCLEGPEIGVYFRGRSQSSTIEMPDYWSSLVHLDSMTVELTAMGPNQDLYVASIADDGDVTVGSNTDTALNYFYVVYGERKDMDRLTIEVDETGEFESGGV